MSIEKPTDELREDMRAHLRSIGMSDEQIDDFWRQVDSGEAYMVAPLKTYDVPPFEPKEWPVVTQGQFIKLVEPAPDIDWTKAPEDATHAVGSGDAVCWRKVGGGSDPCYAWSEHRGCWYESLLDSEDQLAVPNLIARPASPTDIDWSQAPEGATHRYEEAGYWYKLNFVADTASFWSRAVEQWLPLANGATYLARIGSLQDMIARPVEPKEVWSLNGLDGDWNYSSLAELIKDNYGLGCDGGHPLESDGGLQVEDTVFRGIKHYDDPAGFLPDADDVANHMYEQASSSDAGEWADNYPHLDAQAEAELTAALEPLAAWARKHCQPTFFIVENVKPYTITAEDMQ